MKNNAPSDTEVALTRSDTSNLATHLLARWLVSGYVVVLTCGHDLKSSTKPGFTGVLCTVLRQEQHKVGADSSMIYLSKLNLERVSVAVLVEPLDNVSYLLVKGWEISNRAPLFVIFTFVQSTFKTLAQSQSWGRTLYQYLEKYIWTRSGWTPLSCHFNVCVTICDWLRDRKANWHWVIWSSFH